MISGNKVFQNASEQHKLSVAYFHYTTEEADIPTADISKTLELTSKQSGWL